MFLELKPYVQDIGRCREGDRRESWAAEGGGLP